MEMHPSDALTDHVGPRARPTATAVSLPPVRAANIDRLRILAALGIVWFHTEGAPSRQIGYAGLPIFLLIFFSLIVRNAHAGGMAGFVKRRWSRLMVPWLFWSLAYGSCKLAKAVCTTDKDALHDILSAQTLLAGTHLHLWYLPYAFVLGCMIHQVNRWTSRLNDAAVVLVATAAGVFLLAAGPLGIIPNGVRPPLPQWNFGLAAVPLGFALGRSLAIPSRDTQRLLLSMVALATSLVCIMLNSAGFPGLAIPYGLAMVLVCIAYAWHAGSDAFVAAVAPLTFGIYLVHPLISIGLQRVVAAGQHPAALILLTAGISGLVTLGLTKTPLRRFV
jgi:membrane-bound acyltransferase YfiQ involved in biofilm formation